MSPSSPDSVGQNYRYTPDRLDSNVVPDRSHVDRATSIPMPSYHIQRTDSEAQLFEDMAVAEYRDRCMFNRLITGIRQRQVHQQVLHYETQHHQNRHNQRFELPIRAQHQQQQQQQTYTQQPPRRVRHDVPMLPQTRNLHLSKPKDAQKTIESIISTRCQSVQQNRGSSVPSTSQGNIDASTITPLDSYGKCQHQGQLSTRNPSNDWAIEGFGLDSQESPLASPLTSPRAPQKHSLNFIPTHSDQLFDMDL
eukprot:CAMPEP_0204641572 /NCGR_PEP_ID=MMETSP0717-20131115/51211_1 /ASSEMBLY_ACC=CAM_ASM_000666 /TAXON_ID=230516 /ORGANISM="Chaetoceros curvisetus" /LENGTH=250 /DNA_ID=CAMNT_0051662253 /DNA_START=421 /DNA_END=1173 /DNA_ORIENTATION=-